MGEAAARLSVTLPSPCPAGSLPPGAGAPCWWWLPVFLPSRRFPTLALPRSGSWGGPLGSQPFGPPGGKFHYGICMLHARGGGPRRQPPLLSARGLTVRAEGGILSRLYRIHPQETTWRPQWQ